jgi:hypothetical protein
MAPTSLFSDNQSAIRLVQNPEFHKCIKDIDVVYHLIREFQTGGIYFYGLCSYQAPNPCGRAIKMSSCKVETPIRDSIRDVVTWECKEHGVKS